MSVCKQDKSKRNCKKIFLIIAGTFFFILGVIGVFIPLLPTTPFLLLAAACYARSSKSCYNWLLNNRWFGNYIRNYIEGRGISLKIKRVTLTLLWIVIGFSIIFIVENFYIRLMLICIAIGVSIHILRLRSMEQ